jgi:hypothetical protein
MTVADGWVSSSHTRQMLYDAPWHLTPGAQRSASRTFHPRESPFRMMEESGAAAPQSFSLREMTFHIPVQTT